MAAQDSLVSPRRLEGNVLDDLVSQYWPTMDRTRRRAEASNKIIDGEDEFVLPETFNMAGASQYIAGLPHPRTIPQRTLQEVIADRPHLAIPLGPKGLGITGQRLTTRVEQPLNAICEDRRAGFQWERAAGLMLYEGFCASVTVIDPAAWEKHPSAWSDGSRNLKPGEAQDKAWAKKYRVDKHGRSEDDENYDGTVDDNRAKRRHDLDMAVFRARNIPIKHRAIGIRQCAPIFGPNLSVEGLIVSQEYDVSYLRRHYRFGDRGLMTPNGANGEDGTSQRNTGTGTTTLRLIEAWLYDEDGIPYVSYAIKGSQIMEARWKGGDQDGELATLDLRKRFGLERLPVSWEFGLGNPAQSDPDRRAMGFTEPFEDGWRSVRAKMTAINVATMFLGFPVLIEESERGMGDAGIEDDEPNMPDVMPLKITAARPGTTLRALDINPVQAAVYQSIDLELGAIADEAPSKANQGQSGFSQSMAEGFKKLALTTVRESLGRLYEAHGSFVLEAGKRLPELARHEDKPGSGYAPITVFASTDVPVNKNEDAHNEPMELDPDLIDETFTVKAQYDRSMSIPEEQQSMEAVARNLKTRRQHLEDTGDNSPETTELELIAEAQRGTPEFQKYIMGLVAQIQGAEELEEITKGQSEGLANEAGLPMAVGQGVMPALPPGVMPPPQQGMPGVPDGGSLTGFGGPTSGQAALAGTVGGAGMAGPISNVVAAGGTLPAELPMPV